MFTKFFVLTIFLFSFGADAAGYSAVSSSSDRVRRVEYKDDLIVSVTGYSDRPILIDLDPNEPIEDKAGGKMSNWEVYKNGSRIYVRPLEDARPMTMVVASKTRSYVFDMTPGKTKLPESFVSKIIFTYPAPLPTPAISEAAEKLIRDGITPLAESAKMIRNTTYSFESVSGGNDIRPREVFDDGRFTYFKYPANLPIPTVYQSVPGTKDEWLVNSHKDGEYIVIHGVGALWNLRMGTSLIGIFNDAYDAAGVAPVNGTTISGMKREIR